MNEPVAEIHYSGEVHVRPFRRGTYLGNDHLEELIERALGRRYSFGEGWRGAADVTIRLREQDGRLEDELEAPRVSERPGS